VGVVRTLEIFQSTHILGASRGRLCDSSAFLFHIFMGGCQCPEDLAVQLAQVCSVMLDVLFELNKM